uniref:Bidirectional sugar transporter SWEET n=1 Tax=Araucaria cunninghamii TaxID=56994 RepID=A0A0D6R5B5_ARACU
MENAAHFIFGILGNVFGAALFLAPAITFYYVIKRGSTEEFSGLPYVAAIFNCLLYTWYGLPFVSSDNILVTASDGLGAFLEIVYVCLYLAYAPRKYRKKILGLFVAELILFGIIAVVSVMVLRNPARTLLIGILAATMSVCMYGAPLSIMVRSPFYSGEFLLRKIINWGFLFGFDLCGGRNW